MCIRNAVVKPYVRIPLNYKGFPPPPAIGLNRRCFCKSLILNDLRLGSTHSITNAVGYSPWRAWDPVAEREDGKPGAQRVAVYACYDAHGGYDESDLLYLRELRTIA